MEDEDEVDVLGDFCLNLETDLNQYDAGEFPTQNSELLGDIMQHPWLLENPQVWYFDHANEDKNKTLLENMIHEEKKHFTTTSSVVNIPPVVTPTVAVSKVSPIWTKDDLESLRKGIDLYSQNWSKVARAVGTKTTLQVKSYIKSHPELISSSSVHISNTPSPPQFINEVEVSNEDSVPHFSVEDIVYETEVPAVSMEEVIASVATSWELSSVKNGKKTNRSKPKTPSKDIKRVKNSLPVKKAPGRPRKIFKDVPAPLLTYPTLVSEDPSVNPIAVKKTIPILQGEIIRLQRTSEMVDSDSDSEIDIDGSDDEGKCAATKTMSPVKNESKPQSFFEESVVVEKEKKETEICVEPPPLPELPVRYAQDDKSECESSETDSKHPDSGPSDAEPPQPVFTFLTPTEEQIVDLTAITNEEKTIHWDFFEGRPSKTPERYMKIRNSIVNEWRRVKPRYLTKTSVRPSLKNCGDVNCISRVHAYLELIGAINFGCDQVQYNRPLPPVPSHRERVANSGTHLVNHHSLIAGLPARVRKKRTHPENEDENGGYTISHDGSQVLVPSSGLGSQKAKPKKKLKPQSEDQSNPFQLVPCISFGNDKQAPFNVRLSVEALLVIDLHSHSCTTEVIGLLGGHIYSGSEQSQATLSIQAAQPCRSQATNHQCEMCPVSQTEGSEQLRSRGLEVVGWYHSHPTFPALPSLRDLHTQNEFQQWFSRQEAPFVGLIVNPFSTSGIKASMSLKSIIRCITVHDDLPYKHELTIASEINALDDVRETLDTLETNLGSCSSLVPLDSKYPYLPSRSEDGIMNYARKAISSIRAHLEKTVSTTMMNKIEEMAEGFLKRLIERHASRVIVSPVLTSNLPCDNFSS